MAAWQFTKEDFRIHPDLEAGFFLTEEIAARIANQKLHTWVESLKPHQTKLQSQCLHSAILPFSDSQATCVECHQKLTRNWVPTP